MYKFNKEMIFSDDISADTKRIAQYKEYYEIKFDICKRINPKKIAEIGVRAGYSAYYFLQASPKAKYYGFDANNGTHGGKGGEDGKYLNWAKNILSDNDVTVEVMDTQKIDKFNLKGIDLFHIDGDHTIEGAMHDMDMAKETLSEKGYMLVDDIDYVPSVKEAVNQWLKDNPDYKGEYIESLRGEMLICKK